MPGFLVLKIVVAVLVVIALSLVADRAGTAWAGILSGFPTGTAITLCFFALEQGTAFAGAAALYNVSGMCLLLMCIGGYHLAAVRFPRTGLPGRIACSLAGYTAGFAVLSPLKLAPWSSLLIAVAATGAGWFLLRRTAAGEIDAPRPLSAGLLGFRAVVAAAIIVTVTAVAGMAGERWAGLFSAFPATLFPLLLIVDLTYGPAAAVGVIRHVPRGLPALVLFSLALHLAWPALGVAAGMLLAFGVAGCYLLALKLTGSRANGAQAPG